MDPIIPQVTKLTPEEQDNLLRQIKGTPLEATAVLQGIIDPPHIRNFRYAREAFKTQDKDMLKVLHRSIVLAGRCEPVLILGESGTGKELIAKILHGERNGDFVAVNVCAVTDTLFESELFGHVKGAFTGADKDRDGLIKHAEGGTLFLDEIGDMPLPLQAKILRVIQDQTYRKVGSNLPQPVKCRFVTATHRNLQEMISAGTFRLDLFQRLQTFRLTLKPLRNRLEDLPLYVGEDFTRLLHEMANNDEDPLNRMTFTGNVRQLLALKLRYDVFGRDDITVEDML